MVALNLRHQTAAEFAERFWARVDQARRAGDQTTFHRLVWWIWTRVTAGELTSNQVRLSYNSHYGKSLTTAEWNTLMTARLLPIKERYLAMLAEGGL